ncbi:hypothetical protein LK533_14920 [Sphingomonas sp. PL-96]|uniref:hypothetical protein n=1 Tax=Sphingomonas sp. PL-96 TaxID=2887201 RepID=UPI001E552F12|nr:hypothetical protein [Sphingomonas sp. PL-96]MCC2977961.1 hypothetical protein [Sphingomonas sp. PL-96]
MERTNSLDDPARAFDDLRREVSLALRAIQGLAAEHRDQPDYRDTLKALDDRLAAANKALATIATSPAMRLTPQSLTQEIVKASDQARAADAEMLRSAGATSTALMQQLRLGIAQVRVARDQAIEVRWAAGAGLVIGILLWAILPGAVMRSLPVSWHGPEWMATRAMRVEERDAAKRLLSAARPARAEPVVRDVSPPTSSVSDVRIPNSRQTGRRSKTK